MSKNKVSRWGEFSTKFKRGWRSRAQGNFGGVTWFAWLARWRVNKCLEVAIEMSSPIRRRSPINQNGNFLGVSHKFLRHFHKSMNLMSSFKFFETRKLCEILVTYLRDEPTSLIKYLTSKTTTTSLCLFESRVFRDFFFRLRRGTREKSSRLDKLFADVCRDEKSLRWTWCEWKLMSPPHCYQWNYLLTISRALDEFVQRSWAYNLV